jgi:mono/diheme cytochrome c family protein
MRVLAAIGFLAILACLAAIAIIVSGSYSVGADSGHGFVDIVAAYTRERSVEKADATISVPPLDNPNQIAMGAHHYEQMCTGCHLAPGMADNEMRPGMDPRPPKLSNRKHPNPREDFWIVKHGIKMTAMPAWGASHTDSQIWAIVAFLQKLPGMSPEQYASLTAAQAHVEK